MKEKSRASRQTQPFRTPHSALVRTSKPSEDGRIPHSDGSITPIPRYRLRKGLSAWELTFEGKQAVLKHEQGIHYVAYLLLNPPEQPIHALDLATRIAAMHRKQAGLPEITDPVTGKVAPLLSGARLQERSLDLDAAQAVRATIRSQHQLEAILEDPLASEPVKEEVKRDLIQLYRYEEKNTARTLDSAQKCVHAVSTAIKRLYCRLANASDTNGQPHLVLRSFAEHLRKHLLIPSGRYAGAGRARAQTGVAGCFTYEPPPGVTWQA